MLAVGSHDSNIYIYSTGSSEYKLIGTLKGHKSYITSLDWSLDNTWIRSNSGANEYFFFKIEDMHQYP